MAGACYARGPLERTIPILPVVCLLAALSLPSELNAQAPPGPLAGAEPGAVLSPRPSAEHERLDALAGRFKFERTTPAAAGRPAERVTGRTENRWILGARYLECRLVEGAPGAEVETAVVTYGFDLRRRIYFSLAVGSRGSNYRNLEGFWDEPARSLVLLGKDPGDGTASATPSPKLRQVVHVESRDRHVVETFVIYPGRLPQKAAEVVFTRE